MLLPTRGISGDRPVLFEIATLPHSVSDCDEFAREWSIAHALDSSSVENLLGEIERVVPNLVLAHDTRSTERAIAALRSTRHPLASIPIVLTGPGPKSSPRRSGHDAYLCDLSGDRLVRALAQWRPLNLNAYERLEAVFGAAALRPMLARLRDDLAIGLELIEIRSNELSSKAHHLAGICGMLGFERTGTAWRSVFETPESDPCAAWRETRLAIAALDKMSGSRAEH